MASKRVRSNLELTISALLGLLWLLCGETCASTLSVWCSLELQLYSMFCIFILHRRTSDLFFINRSSYSLKTLANLSLAFPPKTKGRKRGRALKLLLAIVDLLFCAFRFPIDLLITPSKTKSFVQMS